MLLAPLSYWRVHHPVKRYWDLVLPCVGGIVLTCVLSFWPHTASPYGANGFIAGLQNLYAILGGFFVAALTLLSTSDSKALSQALTGSPPPRFGDERAPLERRRFLCLLFGYLAFSAFGLYATGFLATLLVPGGRALLGPDVRKIGSTLFLLAYNFWLSHVFVTTLVGLYYFTDKLQKPDPEIVRTRPRSTPAE